MKRRTFLMGTGAAVILPVLSFYQSRHVIADNGSSSEIPIEPLRKSHEAWRNLVSPEAYKVLFEEDTEAAGSSELNHEHRDGTFVCAACYLPLFESQHKYESGTGWPSFTQPIVGRVGTRKDYMLIIQRTEYHCVRCGGHQGHVFRDGPLPRGERWCNNGLALKFVLRTDALPALRG